MSFEIITYVNIEREIDNLLSVQWNFKSNLIEFKTYMKSSINIFFEKYVFKVCKFEDS